MALIFRRTIGAIYNTSATCRRAVEGKWKSCQLSAQSHNYSAQEDKGPQGQAPMNVLSDRCAQVLQGGAHVAEWKALLEKAEQPHMINLTQGFPDFEGSQVAREVAAMSILDPEKQRLNQYSPLVGLTALMQALESLYSRIWDLNLDYERNIVVTSSGSEAVYIAIQSIVSPGDEVIIFEPFFPWYAPCVRLAGGVPIFVRLQLDQDFKIRKEDIEKVFDADKTKMIIVNTPHNPTGRSLSMEEVSIVRDFAASSSKGCVIMSDEAYEGQCWGAKHQKVQKVVQSLSAKDEAGIDVPVITVGTASKLCSLTGWRVGWLLGPESIIAGCKALHGYNTYCAPSPLQAGIAAALEIEEGSFDGTSDLMEINSELLFHALQKMGANVYKPAGGYFVVADVSPFGYTSAEFSHTLMEKAQVACVPMNMFYSQNMPLSKTENSLVRFAICKKKEVMLEAISRIKHFSNTLMPSQS